MLAVLIFLVLIFLVEFMTIGDILSLQITVAILVVVGLSKLLYLGEKGIGHRDRPSGLGGGRTPLWLLGGKVAEQHLGRRFVHGIGRAG